MNFITDVKTLERVDDYAEDVLQTLDSISHFDGIKCESNIYLLYSCTVSIHIINRHKYSYPL